MVLFSFSVTAQEPTTPKFHPLVANMFSTGLDLCPSTSEKFGKLSGGLKDLYGQHVQADKEMCPKIFYDTMGQRDNPNWFLARKYSLSGSRIHKINGAKKKTTLLGYFYESSFQHKNFDHGREMEKRALACSQAQTGLTVLESGFIISSQNPWLASSRDGLSCKENTLIPLEIKCPISDKSTTEISVDYLINQNSELKRSHLYFALVQAHIFVTGSDYCDFFVCSKKANIHLQIKRDDD